MSTSACTTLSAIATLSGVMKVKMPISCSSGKRRDQRVHIDDRDTAPRQPFGRFDQRADTARLDGDEIPVAVGDDLHVGALLVEVKVAVEPVDLDAEPAPHLFGGELALRAPTDDQTIVHHRRAQRRVAAPRGQLL